MNTITGSLSTMSVPDLLQWLLTVAKTGVLSVVRGGVNKRLYFSKGAIVGASSSDPDLAFGQFLLDLGKIGEDKLIELVRRQRETGVMLGRLLQTEGILTEDDVRDVLRLKARETLFELMAWREGDFEFQERPLDDAAEVPLELPIDSIIFEGIRKAEGRRKMREAFPSGNVVPALLSDESRTLVLSDERAAPMVSLMDQGKSIREIARVLCLSVVDVCEILYPYLHEGHLMVGVSDEPTIPRYYLPAPVGTGASVDEELPVVELEGADLELPDPERLVALASELERQGLMEEAVATIDKALEVAPANAQVAETAEKIHHDMTESLWDYFAGGARIPVLAIGLRDLPAVRPLLTPEETFVATRVTGTSTVHDIVQASPMTAAMTLRILRDFADAELIIFPEPSGR